MTCDITDICFSITWFIVSFSEFLVSVSANLGLYSPKFRYRRYLLYLFWTSRPTCNLKIYNIDITNNIRINPAVGHRHTFSRLHYCIKSRSAFGHLLRLLLSIPTCMLHRLCIYMYAHTSQVGLTSSNWKVTSLLRKKLVTDYS